MAIKITGTGSYIPKKAVSNYDLEKMVDTNNDWIIERTGIHQRRVADENESTSYMAMVAAEEALKMANCTKEEIDLLIVGTISGDMIFPSTACVIQEKMGLVKAVSMDVSAACSGFIYALDMAQQYLMNKRFKKALVIGSEKMSVYTDWTDRNTCILFGDGAGAVVVEEKEGSGGILHTEIGSGLNAVDLLKIPGGGSAYPISNECISNKMNFIKMEGREVFKKAVSVMSNLCENLLEKANKKGSDLKLLIPHQANIRIIDAIVKKVKLENDKIFINIDKYGNSSAASVPVALDEAYKDNRINDGDLILLVAFGAGFTWGGMLIEW